MATFYMGRSVFLGHFVKRIIPARNCNVMYFCTKPEKNFTSVMLKSRGHIEVFGEDSVKFLHGLLTNDVNLFHADSLMNVLYAMMLNTKGRVLYDLMLFKQRKETAGFLIECDFNAVEDIIKTFKPYKLRSKVTFNDVTDRYRSWAIIDEGAIEGLKQKNMDSAILVEDPRQPLLGARLVLPREGRPMDYFSNIEESSDQGVYDEHRVKLGVPEGIKDFEPGTPMPLEFNITDLHGVSFQKGCYIGQELTARTYHTGVIRKQLMPIRIQGNFNDEPLQIDKGASITTLNGKRAGKLISLYDNIGLGLMRLDTIKTVEKLNIIMSDGRQVSVTIDWPTWWNME